jgi:hypothetical protein
MLPFAECPMPDLRYPIGPFQECPAPSPPDRRKQISQLVEIPGKLRQTVGMGSDPMPFGFPLKLRLAR